jgi:putative transposase
LVLGGRRVAVSRPRARGVDGHELGLPSWREWSARDLLEARALEQMVLGVSRRYARSLESLPERGEVRGVSKSVVRERFVYGTERKLAELMSRELSDLALVALMIDGVHFAERVVLAVVGVDEQRVSRHHKFAQAKANFYNFYNRLSAGSTAQTQPWICQEFRV